MRATWGRRSANPSFHQKLTWLAIHLRLPRLHCAAQALHDVWLAINKIVPLRHVFIEIEQHLDPVVLEVLPVALTHGFLFTAGAVNAPEQRALGSRLLAGQDRQQVDADPD